ncbi:hypothetical protein NM688_g5223 [Phlebia brevispora]|uniref:Uncharacterized protein n=1 Tax=Phlebia brevispora TaxID=194682 RepID=A0ACC1SYU2_9APHY|nr:hypothetical protein NM688_g5223 [Phlebia brevispora]
MEPQWHTPHDPDARHHEQAPRVPTDVQLCILDCIRKDSGLHRLALTCMLVCQVWAARCAPAAYSRLCIATPRPLGDIEAWITSEMGPDIVWGDRVFRLLRRFAPHITSLRYVRIGDETTPIHTFSPHSATSQMLCSLFAAFSKLNHLSLCEYNFVNARDLLAVLRTLPELRHFEGTSLTWQRAYTTKRFSSTDLRLQSLVLKQCTAVAPLLFIWTMPNGGLGDAPELRFPGIHAEEMQRLMYAIGIGGLRIGESTEGPEFIACIDTTSRCSVLSVILRRWPIHQTDRLIQQLKETGNDESGFRIILQKSYRTSRPFKSDAPPTINFSSGHGKGVRLGDIMKEHTTFLDDACAPVDLSNMTKVSHRLTLVT